VVYGFKQRWSVWIVHAAGNAVWDAIVRGVRGPCLGLPYALLVSLLGVALCKLGCIQVGCCYLCNGLERPELLVAVTLPGRWARSLTNDVFSQRSSGHVRQQSQLVFFVLLRSGS